GRDGSLALGGVRAGAGGQPALALVRHAQRRLHGRRTHLPVPGPGAAHWTLLARTPSAARRVHAPVRSGCPGHPPLGGGVPLRATYPVRGSEPARCSLAVPTHL